MIRDVCLSSLAPLEKRVNVGSAFRLLIMLPMKCTQYFLATRTRPDRAIIQDEWIQHVIQHPIKQVVQTDGRTRRWGPICVLYFSRTVKQYTTRSSTGPLSHENSIFPGYRHAVH